MDSPTRSTPCEPQENQRKVSVLRLTDPTAVGDSREVYDMDVVNLDPNVFEYTQITGPLEECTAIYQHTSAAMRTQSRIFENFESCFVLGPHSSGSFDGAAMRPYSMIAAGPGARAELILNDNYDIVGWLVPPGVLGKHLG